MNPHMLSQLRTTMLASFSAVQLLSGCASGCGCARDSPPQVAAIAERNVSLSPRRSDEGGIQSVSTRIAPVDEVAWREPVEPTLHESSFDLVASPDIGGAPLRVEFDARMEPPRFGIEYLWEFGDGFEAEGPPPIQHTYRQPGAYWAVVTATLGDESTSAAAEVVVETEAFEVVLHANPDVGVVPLTVEFQAEIVGIVQGPFRYHWDFGDGRRSHGRAPRHIYRRAGDFVASVTVWNGDGQLGRDVFEINVEPRRRR